MISLLISIVRMADRILPIFEHLNTAISARVNAYSTNHMIGIDRFMYICNGQPF